MLTDFFRKDRPIIIPYISYGNNSALQLMGRALEDESIDLTHKSLLKLIINSFKRFETDEIASTTLKMELPDGRVLQTDTDDEGYYYLEVRADTGCGYDSGWLTYSVWFSESDVSTQLQTTRRFSGEILVPSSRACYGIISDIDDTILQTGVVSRFKWKLILNTFFKGIAMRTTFKGTPSVYTRLCYGGEHLQQNPIFYLSNSPWNLYRYLEMFLKNNRFPKGPILLRDLNFPHEKTTFSSHSHKRTSIKKILKALPTLEFILIGDASEDDTAIYLEMADQYPQQILAIFIRTVDQPRLNLEARERIEHAEFKNAFIFEHAGEILDCMKMA